MSASADVSLRGPCCLPVTARVPGHPLGGSGPTRPGTRSARLRRPGGRGAGRRGRGQAAGPAAHWPSAVPGAGRRPKAVSRLPEAEAGAGCGTGSSERRRGRVGAARRVGRGTRTGTAKGAQTCAGCCRWDRRPEPGLRLLSRGTIDLARWGVRLREREGGRSRGGPRRQKVRLLWGPEEVKWEESV